MELKEHHLEIQKATRRFVDQEVIPIADRLDREEGLISEDLIQQMADLGIYGIIIPEAWGGAGLDAVSMAIVTEELCRGSLAVGSLPQRNIGMGMNLYRSGTEEQKKRLLPLIASGKIQTASAGTEPEAGSDAANIKRLATSMSLTEPRFFALLPSAPICFLCMPVQTRKPGRNIAASAALWWKSLETLLRRRI